MRFALVTSNFGPFSTDYLVYAAGLICSAYELTSNQESPDDLEFRVAGPHAWLIIQMWVGSFTKHVKRWVFKKHRSRRRRRGRVEDRRRTQPYRALMRGVLVRRRVFVVAPSLS